MDAHTKRSTLRALAVGGVLWLGLVGLSLTQLVVMVAPTLPLPMSLGLGLLVLPGALAIGYVAGRATRRRFVKMYAVSVGLYLLCAQAAAGLMVFAEPPGRGEGLAAQLGNTLWLGLAGAALFGVVFLPLLAAVVFVLERSTRAR